MPRKSDAAKAKSRDYSAGYRAAQKNLVAYRERLVQEAGCLEYRAYKRRCIKCKVKPLAESEWLSLVKKYEESNHGLQLSIAI
jgi:hypothetical protein